MFKSIHRYIRTRLSIWKTKKAIKQYEKHVVTLILKGK